MGPRPAAIGTLAYCRITWAPTRKDSRPRSGSACRGNIHSMVPSAYLHYQPPLQGWSTPTSPRAMHDIDFHARPPPRPPRHSLPTKFPGPQRPPLLRLHWLQKLRLHPSIKYSSALQPLLEVNPLPTTPSTLPSVYPFFQRSYIYFLIVVVCHRPETEPSSPDHTAQHTREGAFPPSTILVTPAERNHSLPKKTIELVPQPPSKD